MTIRIKNNIVIYDDEVIRVGANTTENRPVSPARGMIRFNTTDNRFEGYDGTQWGAIGGASGASYASLIGDGVTNPIVVTHNLDSSRILISIRNVATGYYVYPDIQFTSANTVTLEFVNTPTTNQYFVTILGY